MDNKKPSESVGGVALSYEDFEEITDESSSRYYSFGIVTYDTNADIQGFCDNTVHYCYILHDKDDGKAPHYHIFFTMQKNAKCLNIVQLFKLYGSDDKQNTFCRCVKKNEYNCYDYLTHKNHPNKYQYNESDIVCDDVSKWQKVEQVIDIDSFCDDLFAPTIDIPMMCRKYGRDFMRNIKSYLYTREVVLYENSGRKKD